MNLINFLSFRAGAQLEKFIIKRAKDLNLPFKPSDMNSS